jgi:hypothetical protein
MGWFGPLDLDDVTTLLTAKNTHCLVNETTTIHHQGFHPELELVVFNLQWLTYSLLVWLINHIFIQDCMYFRPRALHLLSLALQLTDLVLTYCGLDSGHLHYSDLQRIGFLSAHCHSLPLGSDSVNWRAIWCSCMYLQKSFPILPCSAVPENTRFWSFGWHNWWFSYACMGWWFSDLQFIIINSVTSRGVIRRDLGCGQKISVGSHKRLNSSQVRIS